MHDPSYPLDNRRSLTPSVSIERILRNPQVGTKCSAW